MIIILFSNFRILFLAIVLSSKRKVLANLFEKNVLFKVPVKFANFFEIGP